MSGLDEILPWAIFQYDPADYDSPDEWYSAVSEDFEENNRLPLDDILGPEKSWFLEAWEHYHDYTPMVEAPKEDIQNFIDEKRETNH